MNKLLKTWKQQILIIICCFSFITISAQPLSLSNKAEISVLTCGTGDEMYALFGHTALRVKDVDQNLDVVYNWGMFNFNTPNFLSRFIKGDLLYYLDVDTFNDFVGHYTADNREVIEQTLNLSNDQKTIIWNEINRQLNGKDRTYTYGFIRNNCTTKVVDVINLAFDRPLKYNFTSNDHSYRYILNEGLDDHYFEKLGINLLFGYPTNKQSNLIFLPVKLKEAISYQQSILKSQEKLNIIPSKNNTFSLNSIYTLWIIIFILSLGALNKTGRFVYFSIICLFSLFLLSVSFYTNHPELYYNVFILFFNPLFIVGLILKNKKIVIVATFLAAFSLFFMGFELLMVIAPLVVLNLVYILALYLKKN